MKRQVVNIAVVGLGYWGPNLVRNFGEVEECRVAMVCDKRDEMLAPVRRKYPTIQVTTEYDDILGNRAIDAVALATPVSTHYDLAKRAMECGKHVLIEKPMTATVREAEDLVRVSERHATVLMVDHTFLYTSSVRKMKELVAGGELGELYYIDSVRINLGLFRPDVNVIWDLATHDFSIIRYLIGEEPLSISVLGKDFENNSVACMAYATLRFRSGPIAHVQVSWLSPVKIRRMTVAGNKRMVIYDDVEPTEKIRVYDHGIRFDYAAENPLQPTYRLGDIHVPRLDQREALLVEAQHFVDCILHGAQPVTDAFSGLSIVRMLAAGDVSLREGGREVKLGSD